MPRIRAIALPLSLLSTLIFSTAVAQQTPVLITQPVNNSVRTILKGNVHPLARANYDRGEVPEAMPLHRMLLVLKRSDEQEAALRRLIENQQYKGSPSYHQWLTASQFGLQFGPADSDIAAVVTWLRSDGFVVNQITNGRIAIEFDGTAGQVKQAFGTALHRYVVNGEEHIANSTEPSIPTALAPVVAGVNSLNDFRRQPQNVFVGTYSEKTKQLESPAPGFTFTSQGYIYDALGPYDFATIYDILPLWNASTPVNGAGQTIAIVGRTDIDPTDATDFWSLFGLDGTHAPQPTLNIIHNGPPPGVTSDEAEADIDTQWSGAVAPGATIDFVTSASTETDDGVDLSALYIVDNNLAPVMSESYGQCELALGLGGVEFYGTMWEEAAAQGISVMVSTGDNGAAGCDFGPAARYGGNVNGLASSPWNAAIGGTDFNQYNLWSNYWNSTNNPVTQESAKGYIPETTWNNSCTNALFITLGYGSNAEQVCNNPQLETQFGGGSSGKSTDSGGLLGSAAGWSTPTWQTGIPNPHDNVRDLPDVSLFASNGFLGSFYIICQKDQTLGMCNLSDLDFQGYGGTSVASPAFAGIMALVNQQYGPQGVPGLVLYSLAAKQPSAFHDVPSGSTNAMPCVTGSTQDCVTSHGGDAYGVLNGWSTATGYDLATGLGSVDVNNLVSNWNKVTFTPSTTTLTLNNGNPINGITHGSAVSVSVVVAPESGSGTPGGDVSLLVSPKPGIPAVDWATIGGNGTASWDTSLLPGGTYEVIAHYGGNSTFGGSYSTASASIKVNPENSSVYMGNPPGLVTPSGYSTSVVYGSNAPGCPYSGINCLAYILRADVYDSQGDQCTTPVGGEVACPTGTISFTDNGSPLDGGTFKLNSEGYTEDQYIQLTGGAHALLASYSGDASYNSSSVTANVTVAPSPTSIPNLYAPSPVVAGQSFSVTGTIAATSSYGLAPGGTVTILANGNSLGTAQLTPENGNPLNLTTAETGVSLTTSIGTPGTYTISANYSGNSNYGATTSNSVQITVTSNQNVQIPGTLTSPATAEPGQQTQTTMQVATSDGDDFASNVTFTCADPTSTGVTCSFSPSITAGMTSPQTVTVTVNTSGPFAGLAGGGVRATRKHARNQGPRLPLTLPLAGVFFIGFAGRSVRRGCRIAGLCLMLAISVFLLACGGGGGSTPPVIHVSVSPNPVNTLWPNLSGAPLQAQQFTATVSGTSNTTVTWAISSGMSTDSISATGLYSAPTSVPPTAVVVTATSQADTTKTGSATVNIQTPTPSGMSTVTVTATEGSRPPQTSTFTLTVSD
jgi:Pro-kumamolisin, activation domain/Bacterial Ig-like domain (group 3)